MILLLKNIITIYIKQQSTHQIKLYCEVLENTKNLFKSIGSENENFKVKGKCLLKYKFSFKTAFKEKNNGVLIYDRVKNKINYRKLNEIF